MAPRGGGSDGSAACGGPCCAEGAMVAAAAAAVTKKMDAASALDVIRSPGSVGNRVRGAPFVVETEGVEHPVMRADINLPRPGPHAPRRRERRHRLAAVPEPLASCAV